MSSKPRVRLTPQEYLAIERQAETKSEYYIGEMFLITGASREYNLIGTNLTGALQPQLRQKPCEIYAKDMRVLIPATGLYTYPDIVVVCNEPKFEDAELDTLLNPTLIIEVLSDSTEKYDRGKKSENYRSIESLREYLLIAQDEPKLEHYARQSNGGWLLTDYHTLEATVSLPAIECNLSLRDMYDKVVFKPIDTGAPVRTETSGDERRR
ncbi:MAG: Uma2 family endonuclease [Pyrinomonadaceae bacterium]|nr:Uma2 family endonuclease [Pyrinomonadaceae bacterium]